MTDVLLVPGLWNSGPEHWQSYWERERTDCRRVLQKDWETPRSSDWVAALDAAVAGSSLPVVFAAHSLGCALVAHWAGWVETRGQGARGASGGAGRRRGAQLPDRNDRLRFDAARETADINSASSLGMWPEGFALVEELRAAE